MKYLQEIENKFVIENYLYNNEEVIIHVTSKNDNLILLKIRIDQHYPFKEPSYDFSILNNQYNSYFSNGKFINCSNLLNSDWCPKINLAELINMFNY